MTPQEFGELLDRIEAYWDRLAAEGKLRLDWWNLPYEKLPKYSERNENRYPQLP